MSWIMFLIHPYVEVLTPNALECDCILKIWLLKGWKQGYVGELNHIIQGSLESQDL